MFTFLGKCYYWWTQLYFVYLLVFPLSLWSLSGKGEKNQFIMWCSIYFHQQDDKSTTKIPYRRTQTQTSGGEMIFTILTQFLICQRWGNKWKIPILSCVVNDILHYGLPCLFWLWPLQKCHMKSIQIIEWTLKHIFKVYLYQILPKNWILYFTPLFL